MGAPFKSSLYTSIQELTKEGHDLLNSEAPKAAVEKFSKALSLSVDLGDEFVQRTCSFNLGAGYVRGGDAALGLHHLKDALPPDKEEEGLENLADLHFNIGLAYQAAGNHIEAIDNYTIAAHSYRNTTQKELEAVTLEKLADCYERHGQLRQGCEALRRAQELYAEMSDTKHQTVILTNLANLHIRLQEIDECAKILNILLNISQDLEDPFLQARVFYDVGLIYSTESCYQSASECFEQALKSIESIPNSVASKDLKGVILQNLGAAFSSMQLYHKAVTYHQRAADVFGELGDRRAQSQVFLKQAFAYCEKKDYESACGSFLHAIQAAKDSGDKEGQGLATEGLAAVHFRKENYDKAIEYYKEALSILAVAGDVASFHSDRIVKKLSNAVEYHVRGHKLKSSSETTDDVDQDETKRFPIIAKLGRVRSDRRINRRSYVTTGLASYDTEDQSEDEDNPVFSGASDEGSDDSSNDTYERLSSLSNEQVSSVQRDPDKNNNLMNIEQTKPISSDTTVSRLKTVVKEQNGVVDAVHPRGQLLGGDDSILKADREFFLAQVQEQHVRKMSERTNLQSSPKMVEKSKMCVVQ